MIPLRGLAEVKINAETWHIVAFFIRLWAFFLKQIPCFRDCVRKMRNNAIPT
jgi:hypothetical protein